MHSLHDNNIRCLLLPHCWTENKTVPAPMQLGHNATALVPAAMPSLPTAWGPPGPAAQGTWQRCSSRPHPRFPSCITHGKHSHCSQHTRHAWQSMVVLSMFRWNSVLHCLHCETTRHTASSAPASEALAEGPAEAGATTIVDVCHSKPCRGATKVRGLLQGATCGLSARSGTCSAGGGGTLACGGQQWIARPVEQVGCGWSRGGGTVAGRGSVTCSSSAVWQTPKQAGIIPRDVQN